MLGLQVLCIEEHGEANCNPQFGCELKSGQTLYGQWKKRRFHNVKLVVSEEVKKVLKGNHVLVDRSLKGNEQYLLLPAVNRTSDVIPVQEQCTLERLFVANEVSARQRANIQDFFCGDERDVMVQLRSFPVWIIHHYDENKAPKAVCGKQAIEKLRRGWDSSKEDVHGCPARDDVEEALDIRSKTKGISLAFVGHKVAPQCDNVPMRSALDQDIWWEGPVSTASVLSDGSVLVLLKASAGVAEVMHRFGKLMAGEAEHETAALAPGKALPLERLRTGDGFAEDFDDEPPLPQRSLVVASSATSDNDSVSSAQQSQTQQSPQMVHSPPQMGWPSHAMPPQLGDFPMHTQYMNHVLPCQMTPPMQMPMAMTLPIPIMPQNVSQPLGFGYFGPDAYTYQQEWQQQEEVFCQRNDERPLPRVDTKAGKAGFKVPKSYKVQKEKDLLEQLAKFEVMIDDAASGKLEKDFLARAHRIVQRHARPDLESKEAELMQYLMRQEGQYESHNLVHYAMHEGSHEVAQKAFELATLEQKTQMVQILERSIKLLMKDKHGGLFLQQVLHSTCNPLEMTDMTESQETFLRTVVEIFQKCLQQKNALVTFSNHQQGNYVVQVWVKFLQLLPDCFLVDGKKPLFLFADSVFDNILEIGVAKIGCRVVSRLLEGKRTPVYLIGKLLEPSTLESLMISEGGNYVAQGILEKGSAKDIIKLINHIGDNFNMYNFRQGKTLYASNSLARHVLQKAFEMRTCQLDVREAQARVLKVVLDRNGQVKTDFLYLDLDHHVVQAMQDCQRAQQESKISKRSSAKAHPRHNGW
jgi:hypothetical protein